MAAGFDQSERDELARTYHARFATLDLLRRAGLSPERLPHEPADGAVLWREIDYLVGQGVLPNGRARILAEAARDFPANTVFTPGRAPLAGLAARPAGCPRRGRRPSFLMVGTAVLAVLVIVMVVLLHESGSSSPNGSGPSAPPRPTGIASEPSASGSPGPTSPVPAGRLTEAQLAGMLLRLSDLSGGGWSAAETDAGEQSITADDFCGRKPTVQPELQHSVAYRTGRNPVVNQAAVFSTAAEFDGAGAHAFIAQVHALATSCTSWPYRVTTNASPVTNTIDTVDSPRLGEESLRVIVSGPVIAHGPPAQEYYVYVRRGDIVTLTYYQLMAGLLGGSADVDPAIVTELATTTDSRLHQLR